MLIGSLVSSIKVSLVRFTIYKPPVSLEDRRANVLRGQRLLAFSVYTAYYHMLTATSIRRNFLEEKTNSNSPSRHLFRKVNRRVPVLFRKVDINRPFYRSQRHIGNATAHTWEWGWGWLALNLCECFWWNSYVGSKIVRFLRKMDGPSRNLDKANFSPKKERKAVCRFWLFKYILWHQWFAYELSLLQVYARRHVFLLSIYRSILILFSVNYGWA